MVQMTDKGIIRGHVSFKDIAELTGKVPVAIKKYSIQQAGHDYWCGYWGHSYHVESVTNDGGLYDISVINEGGFPNVHSTFLDKGDYELLDHEYDEKQDIRSADLRGAEWKTLLVTGRLDTELAAIVDRCVKTVYGLGDTARYKLMFSRKRNEYYLGRIAA